MHKSQNASSLKGRVVCVCAHEPCSNAVVGQRNRLYCSRLCKQREHTDRHREAYRAKWRRKDRRRRATEGTHTEAEIQALWAQYDEKCAYCGDPAEHADHFIPLKLGGTDNIDNIRPSCAACNLSKGGKDPKDWMRERGIYHMYPTILRESLHVESRPPHSGHA